MICQFSIILLDFVLWSFTKATEKSLSTATGMNKFSAQFICKNLLNEKSLFYSGLKDLKDFFTTSYFDARSSFV